MIKRRSANHSWRPSSKAAPELSKLRTAKLSNRSINNPIWGWFMLHLRFFTESVQWIMIWPISSIFCKVLWMAKASSVFETVLAKMNNRSVAKPRWRWLTLHLSLFTRSVHWIMTWPISWIYWKVRWRAKASPFFETVLAKLNNRSVAKPRWRWLTLHLSIFTRSVHWIMAWPISWIYWQVRWRAKAAPFFETVLAKLNNRSVAKPRWSQQSSLSYNGLQIFHKPLFLGGSCIQ